MNQGLKLSEITRGLTVLCVEDEPLSMKLLEVYLREFFDRIIFAGNGAEGLEKFRQQNVDLIITDNMMPVMNGLEMLKEIRKSDTKTPIVLVTAYIDADFLIKAINLGVTQFVGKPVSFESLTRAIEIAVQWVVLKNLQQKTREQEMELLKYQEKYHYLQQERASKKALNIIREDLFLKKLDSVNRNGEQTEWFFDVYYRPLDVMSGDSYSVRTLANGNIFIFIIDAMGKGLSASVTAIITTSFLNYLIDNANITGSFNFEETIDTCRAFIQKRLVDEEILCISFVYIDIADEFMDIALFSMPPVLAQTCDDMVLWIKCNNLPIMKFANKTVIDRYEISNFKKLLISTDGLNESFKDADSMYQESLEEDFRTAGFIREFLRKFGNMVDKPDDDVTFLFIKKQVLNPKWEKSLVIPSRLEALKKATDEIESIIVASGFDKDIGLLFIDALAEMLMNAYEHGNLGIDYKLKNSLIKRDAYDEYLSTVEKTVTKSIAATLSLYEEDEREYLKLMVRDEGAGFDSLIMKELSYQPKLFNGRGIKIAQNFMDEVYYNMKGNEAFLIKQVTRG